MRTIFKSYKVGLWLLAGLLIGLFSGCATQTRRGPEKPAYDYARMDKLTRKAHVKVEMFLSNCKTLKQPVPAPRQTRIDSLKVNEKAKTIAIYFSKPFSFLPYREDNVAAIYRSLKKELGRKFRRYQIGVYALQQPIEQLIPNFFRADTGMIDRARLPIALYDRPAPLVRNLSKPWQSVNGLWQRNIVLWHSHGWYYSNGIRRWEWQRPRLFQTVEDLLTLSFTQPYLIPMLEAAGANVLVPRERDLQPNMVIVDNDPLEPANPPAGYQEFATDTLQPWQTGAKAGFKNLPPPYPANFNLFSQGSHRTVRTDTVTSAGVRWQPTLPERGNYAVYVSYQNEPENVPDARYRVYHLGGETEFSVNQQIGGGTWIYLGTFQFPAGLQPEQCRVELVNQSAYPGRTVSADAVRFGGGMGDVQRNGLISGRPRYQEASRYYLQFAGMPDTLVYNLHDNQDDYKDDYRGRPEYVNYLYGAPFGPNKNRQVRGLGIPIDLSLALHTDAGITSNDTTIGTLAIYSIEDADSQKVFPDGVSRLANRDLADLVQSQLTTDLRAKYDPAWNRRQLMESQYAEAVRPNVPSLLLELLSHQNMLDMQFALDPRFRFDAARAIYKGILKYLSFQNRQAYVVQPLPISHFQVTFSGTAQVSLKWRPTIDVLEPTARPVAYVVYTRIEDRAFDNGQIFTTNQATFSDLEVGKIYSFQVCALNSGGESQPSEILSVCWQGPTSELVLIVNGFDRIAGPARIHEPNFSGFLNFLDNGVPERQDINFTGEQFNFNPKSAFRLNDSPGHGASFADYETRTIVGNTFDYPRVHGQSLRAGGYAFVSASDEAIMEQQLDLTQFKIIDLILGEEKETSWPKTYGDSLLGKQFKTFPEKMQQQIQAFCAGGGNLLVSGAYVGSDLCANKPANHPDVVFAKKVLKFNWITDHAARTGQVYASANDFQLVEMPLGFNTELGAATYAVEAPDAIQNVEDSRTVLRYVENQFGAATAFKKDYRVVVLAFPFESILSQSGRDQLMQAILNFFKK